MFLLLSHEISYEFDALAAVLAASNQNIMLMVRLPR
jgi:hypothetical protein